MINMSFLLYLLLLKMSSFIKYRVVVIGEYNKEDVS